MQERIQVEIKFKESQMPNEVIICDICKDPIIGKPKLLDDLSVCNICYEETGGEFE